MKLLFALLLMTSAQAHEKHSHREHGAHQHGAGEVSIAFDGLQGKVEFKSSSESIVGFEHAAKSAKDIKTRDEAFTKFEKNISQMIAFDKSLGCSFKKEKLEMTVDGKHSDTLASFQVQCTKSPEGSTLVLSFVPYFPNLKDVDVQILVGPIQKSAEVHGRSVKVDLK